MRDSRQLGGLEDIHSLKYISRAGFLPFLLSRLLSELNRTSWKGKLGGSAMLASQHVINGKVLFTVGLRWSEKDMSEGAPAHLLPLDMMPNTCNARMLIVRRLFHSMASSCCCYQFPASSTTRSLSAPPTLSTSLPTLR